MDEFHLGIRSITNERGNDMQNTPGGDVIEQVLTVLASIWFVVVSAVVVALPVLLFILGILIPWFIWRTKVYTKRTYLLLTKVNENVLRVGSRLGGPQG